jgi:hypothetical protein
MDTGPLKAFSPQCNTCLHHKRGTATCDAFPERIPDAILMNEFDHHKPYPGDHGIQFEPLAPTK